MLKFLEYFISLWISRLSNLASYIFFLYCYYCLAHFYLLGVTIFFIFLFFSLTILHFISLSVSLYFCHSFPTRPPAFLLLPFSISDLSLQFLSVTVAFGSLTFHIGKTKSCILRHFSSPQQIFPKVTEEKI